MAERELTFGEKAVGLSFNPSGNADVTLCKKGVADLIDQLHQHRRANIGGEIARLASVAITALQGAQMWAVKALTYQEG